MSSYCSAAFTCSGAEPHNSLLHHLLRLLFSHKDRSLLHWLADTPASCSVHHAASTSQLNLMTHERLSSIVTKVEFIPVNLPSIWGHMTVYMIVHLAVTDVAAASCEVDIHLGTMMCKGQQSENGFHAGVSHARQLR